MKLYVLSDLHVEFAPFALDLAAAEALSTWCAGR